MKRNIFHSRKLFSVSVRKANLADAPHISSLFLEWLNEKNIEGRPREIRKAISAEEIVVAEDLRVNNLIGFIHSIIHNDPISGGPLVYLTAFYVRKDFRGKGVGSAMLKFVLDNSVANGVVGAEVATAHPNAVRLYKRFGFTQFKAEIGEILLGLDLKKKRNTDLNRD